MYVRGGLVLFFDFFFIFACFRRVLGLIFVSFSFFFLACLKTELC